MSIEISNESEHILNEDLIVQLSRHVLSETGVHALAELSILIIDAEYMSELNERWMEKKGPTDVLAFPMDALTIARHPGSGSPVGAATTEEAALLGDVVLCPSVIYKKADAAGEDRQAEFSMLLVHGILHLLGYDHAEPEEKSAMFALQDRLLASWRRTQKSTQKRSRPPR